MDRACPLCNGLEQVNNNCPRCGTPLADGGPLDNYLGPYSPYETQVIGGSDHNSCCTHLIYCPNCGQDQRIEIPKVEL